MIPLRFTYLFGTSLFLIPWAVMLVKRKDLRTSMFFNGVIFSFFAIIVEYFFWTRDWWHPLTITFTRIGVEDFLLSLGNGGVMANLYFFVFSQRIPASSYISKKRLSVFIGLIFCSLALFFLLIYVLHLLSFWATLIICGILYTVLAFYNRQLIGASLMNGILSVILVLPVYWAMSAVTPDFIEKTWIVKNMIGGKVMGIPFEDYIFYFVAGMLSFLIAPFVFGT